MHRRRKAAGLVVPPNRNPINDSLFESWSDNLAWLVGLIWSDGCLYGNTIEISSKDLQLIDLVISILGGGNYGLKNRGRHIRVHFSSPRAASFLRAIGLSEHKSLTITWPDVPDEYSGHFMRGLIDGDGSVLLRQHRVGQQAPDLTVQLVTASEHLKDSIGAWFAQREVVYSLNVRTHPDNPTWHPLWRFTITRHESLRHLFTLLYPSSDVACLHRKHSPYRQWMDTPRHRAGRPTT